MQTHEVSFYSEGDRISALWRISEETREPRRAIVQGPGWLGLKDAELYVPYHEALTAAGFGVLIIDYRGFGDSDGAKLLSPTRQLQDLRNAVTYLTTREDVDPDTIGALGSGGTGGGNAVLLTSVDRRVRAAVSQVPIADGRDWLHRMRSEHEWLEYLGELERDRKARTTRGEGRLVHPREEIMVPTPERRETTIKSDVDDRIPSAVSFAAADEIMDYRPVEAAANLRSPLLVVAVEDDATTPTEHAVDIYEAAQGPRKLLMQRHTTHYAAYKKYRNAVTREIVDWFDCHVRNGNIVATSHQGSNDTIDYLGD